MKLKTGDIFDFNALSPDGEGMEITTTARVDRKLPINLISRHKAIATSIRVTKCASVVVEDSDGRYYESSSFIALRWSEVGVPKTYDALFYVIDESRYDVVLGANAPDQHSEPGSEYHVLEFERETEEEKRKREADAALIAQVRKAETERQDEKERIEREQRRKNQGPNK